MKTTSGCTALETLEPRECFHNPCFFIVGFPQSGTSLLRQILDAHSQIAVAPDVHWISKFFETRTGLNLEGRMAIELLRKWADQDRFAPFEIEPEEVIKLIAPGELVSLNHFLTRLLDRYGESKGKPLVGSETSEYMSMLPDLHVLWPQAKFIHLLRDGRDVCLSVLTSKEVPVHKLATWTEDPVSTTALWWKRKVQQGRKEGRMLGPEWYHELSYESLVTHPAEECARLCAFLGVSFEHAMLRVQESQTAMDAGNVNGKPPTPALQDWRRRMPAEDVERFEAAAGDLLDALGQPRAYPCPRPEAVAHASKIGERFAHAACASKMSPRSLARRRQKNKWTNPFVFIVGCPRSGTTLLQRIMDAHPDIAICDETFWLVYYFKKRIGLTPEGLITPELIAKLLEYYKFCRMKIGREDLDHLLGNGQAVHYSSFVSRIFDHYGEIRGKPLVGDKTPDYARNLPTLHALWPEAKFVHLIRDGRDVCLSVINWKRKAAKLANLYSTWGEHPVGTAAAWWEWHVRLGRQAGRSLGPALYYELRYEALVSDPAEELAKLRHFLGVPYNEAMLHFHEGRTKADPGLDAKNAWLPITPALRDWRSQMLAEDVERFEAAAGELLDELGYTRGVPRPGWQARQCASPVREAFSREAQALGDWLP